MSRDNFYLRFAKNILPSPFTIAVLLTAFTFLVAWLLTAPTDNRDDVFYIVKLMGFWEKGFWELLSFSMQMVLILVLGHTLALSRWSDRVITVLTRFCSNTANAAALISLISIGVSALNWGLCLIIGAVFVRKVGEYAHDNRIRMNYPLLGAAGYSGLMTWHGGFSGSAPLKVAEDNHFLMDSIGQIAINETILSPMNMTAWGLLITIIPLAFYYMGKKMATADYTLAVASPPSVDKEVDHGVEKMDHSRWVACILGSGMLLLSCYKVYSSIKTGASVINLNYINFVLFGLCLVAHGTIAGFLSAVQKAVSGATGIIIQFPLYAGIMGVMKYSGLVLIFSNFFIEVSTPVTFPIFTLLSAGLVNTFVPSGGGQWAVQGPIVCEAAQVLGVPVSKAIMALSYGDQLTNMIQPFWALPLLGITRLKAGDILPYSFLLMLLGLAIYSFILLLS